jgi:hypothetical protein
MKSKKCSLFVWVGKKPKAYLVNLSKDDQENVLAFVQQLHGGTVQAFHEPFESLELRR